MDNFKFNFLSRNSKLFKLKQEFNKALNVFPLLRELLKTTPCRKIVLYILIGGTELIFGHLKKKLAVSLAGYSGNMIIVMLKTQS